MAKVMYGGGVAKISGKLGGSVHARNLGGNYMRNWVSTPNPNTLRQQEVRGLQATASRAWADLSAAERKSWSGWAASNATVDRLGQRLVWSGFNAFVSVYLKRSLNYDTDDMVNPPAAPVFTHGLVGGDAGIICDTATDTLNVTLGDPIPPYAVIQIWSCGFIPVTRNFTRELMTYLTVFINEEEPASGITLLIGSNWVSKYGSMSGQAGKRVRLWLREYNEGRYSPFQYLTGVST